VRCRTLYEKQIEWNPSNSQSWIQYAELERGLDDLDRARALYELGIEQPTLDMPELVWKSYIDFEEYEGEYDRVRALYERLLAKTDHVKVWINYARFEINIPEDEEEEEEEERPVSEDAKRRARAVFDRAHKVFKDKELKEEVCIRIQRGPTSALTAIQRVELLNAWRSFEHTHGSPEDIDKIEKQMPRRVKKRRKLEDDRYEEYMDYVFPADDKSAANLSKLLQKAHQWKQGQA
jgi:crooked neck